MKAYLARSWVHPALAGGESRIHGEGVFATAPIARGEKLMEFGGEKISGAQAASGDYRECSVWTIADDLYLALPESDPEPSLDENLNHSCDANAWLADEVMLVARRDIGCGSAGCRKRLTERDWTHPDVQERYRGHFHPLVQKLIDTRG